MDEVNIIENKKIDITKKDNRADNNFSAIDVLQIINKFNDTINQAENYPDSIIEALSDLCSDLNYDKIYFFQKTPHQDEDNYLLLFDIKLNESNTPDYLGNIIKNQVFKMKDFSKYYEELLQNQVILLNYQDVDFVTRNVFDTMGLFSIIVSLIKKDDEIIGFWVLNKTVTDTKHPKMIYDVARIISDKMAYYFKINNIHNDLLNSNDRLIDFVNNVSDGILITENYNLLYVNDRFKEIFNITDDFFLNGNLNSWGLIDVLDIETYVKHHKVSNNNTLYEIECWVNKDKDSQKRFIRKKLLDIRESKSKVINFLIIKDLTEKKKAELELRDNQEKFRLISELTTDCSYSFQITSSNKYVFEWCSGSYKDLFGVPIRNKETDTLWHSRVYEDDRPKLNLRMNNLQLGRKDITEYRVYDKAGNIRWIRDYGVPVFDQFENRAIKIIGAAADITEQKEAEEKLISSTDELKNINLTKDKFFSIVSHDMKNPILGFKNLTELLLDEYDTIEKNEVIEILSAMKQSSESLFEMFEDLVQWSKAQMGKLEFKPEEYDITNVVLDVIHQQKAIAKQKNIRIINRIKIGTSAYFDNNMISIVIRNLVSNAIKFSFPDSDIEIFSDTIKTTDSKSFLVVEVKDNGVGIPESNMQKLFKSEIGFSTFGTANEKGTGLGLLLCKEFVTINGGTIWAVSKDSKGTSFKFTIPK